MPQMTRNSRKRAQKGACKSSLDALNSANINTQPPKHLPRRGVPVSSHSSKVSHAARVLSPQTSYSDVERPVEPLFAERNLLAFVQDKLFRDPDLNKIKSRQGQFILYDALNETLYRWFADSDTNHDIMVDRIINPDNIDIISRSLASGAITTASLNSGSLLDCTPHRHTDTFLFFLVDFLQEALGRRAAHTRICAIAETHRDDSGTNCANNLSHEGEVALQTCQQSSHSPCFEEIRSHSVSRLISTSSRDRTSDANRSKARPASVEVPVINFEHAHSTLFPDEHDDDPAVTYLRKTAKQEETKQLLDDAVAYVSRGGPEFDLSEFLELGSPAASSSHPMALLCASTPKPGRICTPFSTPRPRSTYCSPSSPCYGKRKANGFEDLTGEVKKGKVAAGIGNGS